MTGNVENYGKHGNERKHHVDHGLIVPHVEIGAMLSYVHTNF